MSSITNQQLETIREPVRSDLASVDDLILSQLTTRVPLIRTICQHILKSGGKRLRPLLVLLMARATGYCRGTEHHELATIIEFVHTATLLHDDVIDESSLRRGKQTANALWGNAASVLVGDFLYSRAFQLLTQRSHVPVMHVLANTTNAIAEGEILQLANCHNPNITEQHYLDVIACKTAKLFESAAEIGAILGQVSDDQQRELAQYGYALGMAFQIIDDVLDYSAKDDQQIGKHLGDDLAEGKTTLPLIYALQHVDDATAKILRTIIKQGDTNKLPQIITCLRETNAFTYCYQQAESYIQRARQALNVLDPSPYKTALDHLITFAVARTF